mgnify:CR=1 FL=1
MGLSLLALAAVSLIFASKGTMTFSKANRIISQRKPNFLEKALPLYEKAIKEGIPEQYQLIAGTLLIQYGNMEKGKEALEELLNAKEKKIVFQAKEGLSMYYWIKKDTGRAIKVCEEAKEMGFKDKKGRKVEITPATDTTKYAQVSKGWKQAMASGPLLILDDEIVVPVLMGNQADGANVAAMIKEQKEGYKHRTHYSSAQFYDKRHPRAAFGIDADGYAYLVVIDGRFPGKADGASIFETAYICHLLGMTDAINLDGGGSTTLWTEKTGVINYPCDNKKFDHEGERSVPNLIIVR